MKKKNSSYVMEYLLHILSISIGLIAIWFVDDIRFKLFGVLAFMIGWSSLDS